MQKTVMIGNCAMSPDFAKYYKALPKEELIKSLNSDIETNDGVLLRMQNDVGFMIVRRDSK